MLEYGSQLPHDGGAFYSSETTEIVRKFYANCWWPILFAASLTLAASGFEKADEEIEIAKTDPNSFDGKLAAIAIGGKKFVSNENQLSQKTPHQLNSDRLYLLIGKLILCVNAASSVKSPLYFQINALLLS